MNNFTKPDQLGLATSPEQNSFPGNDSKRRLQEITSTLHVLAKKAATMLAAKACCIYVLDQKRQELVPQACWCEPDTVTNFTRQTVGHGVVGQVAQAAPRSASSTPADRRLIRVDDLRNDSRFKSAGVEFPHNSILAQPLAAPGSERLMGILLVVDKIGVPAFSPQDEQLLTTFVGQFDLILALENLELHQEKGRWAQGLTIVSQINQIIAAPSQQVDIESICRQILSESSLQELFQFEFAEICLWDDQSETLTTVEYAGDDNAGAQAGRQTYGLNEGYSGWIAANHQPLLIKDTHQYPHVTPKGGLANFPYRSYLGTTLKVGSKFLGTLEMAVSPPNFYDQIDAAILEVVADQLAVVIDRARLLNLTDQQLHQRVEELAGLKRISSQLNSTLDLDLILNLVLKEALRVTQADFGNVDLYETRSGETIARKAQGRPHNAPLEINHPAPSQNGIVKRALRTKTAYRVADVGNDKDFVEQGQDIRSQLVAPILYGDEPVGIINLTSTRLNFFTNDQLDYLQALADQAAVAIANAQEYQEQKQERERANRRAGQLARLSEISNTFRTNRPLPEVLEEIAFAVMESVGYNMVLISLVEGDPPVICHQVGPGIPIPEFEALRTATPKQPLSNLEAIMRDEFRLGTAYFIPAEQMDVWQNRLDMPTVEKQRRPGASRSTAAGPKAKTGENSWQAGDLLLVPLTDSRDNIIGLLAVQNPDTDQRPDLAVVQILDIFANYAAVAVENARLFELEQQRRRLADTLRGVAETISAQLEFQELLNVVLRELQKVVDYDKATVELLEDNHLEIIGGQGWEEYSQQIIGLTFSMEGNNPGRRVVEIQEPLIVKDARAEYAAIFSAPPYDRIRSWLGVPLTYGTNVLGLMAVGSSLIDFFTQDDADVVLAFANQVAVALQNARLFNEAREQVRQLAALTEVAQSINRALDLDEVLNLVLDAVFDLVGHDQGSIWLIEARTRTIKIANTKNIHTYLVELFNESAISVESEPFASIIQSGQVQLIPAGSSPKKSAADEGLSFPDDVTYVPLKSEEGVIGILVIETLIHSQTMLKLVTTLADLAAVAIDNAQLVQRLNLLTEELEQRVIQRTKELAQTLQDLTEERDRVETLYQITRELASSLDLDRVLIEALNHLNRSIGISHGSILLLDQGSGELIYRAALGRDKPLPRGGIKTKYTLGYGLAGTIMELNEARIVPDLSHDPDWIPDDDDETTERRSALAVPLATGDGMMGTLLLFHPEPGYFTEDQLRWVSTAGTVIANAINNAGLYRLITDQAERLGIMLRTEATESAKNQAILKSIADGVLVLDKWRNIVLLNPKAAEILDVNPETVENQPISHILGQSESPVELELAQLFHDNLLNSLEAIEAGQASAEFRIQAGSKTVVVTLTPLAVATEESLSVVAVLRDISREAEIERIKNEFISTVSHELRTPMTSVKGYADLLVSGKSEIGELNPTQRRFVKVIQANANRLTELVNEILEISRIETGRVKLQFETLDVIELIDEVAFTFKGQMAQKSMQLSLALPDTLPRVYTDKARLIQILVNLIGNAWQYSPEESEIIVQVALVDEDSVQIDVKDRGIGIPEKDIEFIFDRFFRSERPEVEVVDGTGLGLSITQSYVELLGGEIWVKSQLDVGSTFSFTLPIQAQPPTTPANEDQPGY